MSRVRWSRKLSKPIGRFRCLADIRDYILAAYPNGPPQTWHRIGTLAVLAAEGGDMEDLEVSLKIMKALGKPGH